MQTGGLLPRAPRPTARAERRASQRERLLVGIADCVAEDGYAAASVARIARHAGVSTRTFYEHFTDKEDCLLAAYDVAVETAVGRLQAAYAPALPWRDRLGQLLQAWFELLASEPSFTRIYALEIWHATPTTQQRAVQGTSTLCAVFRQANRDAIAEDARVVAVTDDELQLLAGGTHRLMLLRVLAGETAKLPELVPAVLAGAEGILARTAPA